MLRPNNKIVLIDYMSCGLTRPTTNAKYTVLIDNVPAIGVAGGIAVMFIVIAFLLPVPKKK